MVITITATTQEELLPEDYDKIFETLTECGLENIRTEEKTD